MPGEPHEPAHPQYPGEIDFDGVRALAMPLVRIAAMPGEKIETP
jgi:hypothetical protein